MNSKILEKIKCIMEGDIPPNADAPARVSIGHVKSHPDLKASIVRSFCDWEALPSSLLTPIWPKPASASLPFSHPSTEEIIIAITLRASRVYFCQALHTNLPHKFSGSAEYLDLPARCSKKEDKTARPVQIPEQFFTLTFSSTEITHLIETVSTLRTCWKRFRRPGAL